LAERRLLRRWQFQPDALTQTIGLLSPQSVGRVARCGHVAQKIVQWRATVDEDGHYCFAVAQ
jgi:hypothetical protein